jgi:hypothetical protein
MRDRILHLARTRYVGFNDHHLCEKLGELEGISLGRETLRRLLRQNGLGSPKKRRAPAHRQRRLSNDNVVQWDGRRFQIPPQPKRFSFAGAKVQLCESLRGSIEIYYGDSKLHHAD